MVKTKNAKLTHKTLDFTTLPSICTLFSLFRNKCQHSDNISAHDFNEQAHKPGRTKPFMSSNGTTNVQFFKFSFLSVKTIGICYNSFNARNNLCNFNQSEVNGFVI